MKNWGLFLITIGIFCWYTAITMDTSVDTGGTYEYGIYIPKTKVNNLGLMNQQTNLLIRAGISFISGILLFGFGAKSSPPETTRKCPYCAELIKVDAIFCRFCQKDLPILSSDEPSLLSTCNDTTNKLLRDDQIQKLKISSYIARLLVILVLLLGLYENFVNHQL